MKKQTQPIKKFKVSFRENKKYNPMTRTIDVSTGSDEDARRLIRERFGDVIVLRVIEADEE